MGRIIAAALIAFCLAACGAPPTAGPEAAPLAESPSGARAISGDRFTLEIEGEVADIRLAGIRTPRSGPSAELALARLQVLLDEVGGNLVLIPAGPGRNRYGALLVTATRGDGSTLQEILVGEGLAAVDSHGDNTAHTSRLLVLEEEARLAGLGAWGLRDLLVHTTDPNALAPWLDSVQIVEGRVISTGAARDGRIYLNFGTDWRTDFTVQVMRRDQRRFEAHGIDLRALEGAVVRVRGWMYAENGPMILLDHPEALELVDAPEAARLPGR
ncbi:nuclease [Glycocaulis alkaliphilus]|uniref:Nuclease n=1 Tax=Glycocaulis alkaliphilus TaxID=1434191 RepID=A0A3T0E5U5_9PROT|nr:thermonuclease family protein [Glycocaulis alkaliphilus]AZU02596.1 nuclease [Glycocaulis alkaliphilus]